MGIFVYSKYLYAKNEKKILIKMAVSRDFCFVFMNQTYMFPCKTV